MESTGVTIYPVLNLLLAAGVLPEAGYLANFDKKRMLTTVNISISTRGFLPPVLQKSGRKRNSLLLGQWLLLGWAEKPCVINIAPMAERNPLSNLLVCE